MPSSNHSPSPHPPENLVGSLWQLAVSEHLGDKLASKTYANLCATLPLRSLTIYLLAGSNQAKPSSLNSRNQPPENKNFLSRSIGGQATHDNSSAGKVASSESALGGTLAIRPRIPLHRGQLEQLFLFRSYLPTISTPLTRDCSDAHWLDLFEWAQTGFTLIQPSPKRSGKLAWLAPDEAAGNLIAIPLRPQEPGDIGPLGVAVLEIELGRSIPASVSDRIGELGPPLWWMLQSTWATQADDTAALSEDATAESSTVAGLERRPDVRRSTKDVVIGAEAGLKAVMERVTLVAPSDLPILILGDTGTGKEVIARAIHARSPRAKQPFLRVNCGAIPPDLIDSLLFGHERGSFTGALDQRKGWFERANGGTLFLDEIGELPSAAQVRLLRVLQEHQIERVGGQQTIDVDVRIVAATHRDLATMVHQRTFREDLWYRINLFPILLPRLCERLDDIPSLTRHFAKRAADNFGVPYAEPTTDDLDRLLSYPWPGNVRELQAVIDRAVILGKGHHLDIATSLGSGFTLPPPVGSANKPTFYEVIPESNIHNRPPSPIESIPVDDSIPTTPWISLNEAIKKHIEKALLMAHGRVEGKSGAAELLKINPHTLRAKMRKLGIQWANYRRDENPHNEI